jgi:hypothetical protein
MTKTSILVRGLLYVITGLLILLGLLLWFAFGPENYAISAGWSAVIYIGFFVVGLPLLIYSRKRRRKQSFSDEFWYVTAGLLVVLIGIVWATYVPYKYGIASKWMFFGLMTVLMFVYVIRSFRHAHKSTGFWACLFGLFCLHIFVFGIALKITEGPKIFYILIMPLETMLFALILSQVFRVEPEAPDI